MASKHLKKSIKTSDASKEQTPKHEAGAKTSKTNKSAAETANPKKPKAESPAKAKKPAEAKTKKPAASKPNNTAAESETKVFKTASSDKKTGQAKPKKPAKGTQYIGPDILERKTPAPAPAAQTPPPAEDTAGRPMSFHREKADKPPRKRLRELLSQRDAVGAVVSLTAAVVLLAATVITWFYWGRIKTDGIVLSTDTAAVAVDEYVFDAGSGQAFAAVGQGLAVANATGLELLDGSGIPVTSKLLQMENPATTGCADYAVFYDLGGTRIAAAWFDGTVEELTVPGNIISATVSHSGYLAVTTEATGYRALVTVYDPSMDPVYQWYSSSAWVISASVSPDGRKLAVLSYTVSGSEVRFFNLTQTEQLAAFSVSDTVLLDVHWFSSNQLCAFSSGEVFFFDADGVWQNTYSFQNQYLVGYTLSGEGYGAFALSPYRAGTTATLVSLDAAGNELGTEEVSSGIVNLTCSGMEIMVLCADGAILYNSSLSEKGRLTGLPGFKYGFLRGKGEALLIASNYAEVYNF